MFIGAIDAFGSQKTTKFITLCNHFGSAILLSDTTSRFDMKYHRLPILNLVDQPGFAIGKKIARHRHYLL